MIANPLLLLFALATLAGTVIIAAGVAYVVLGGDGYGPNDACRNPVTGEERPVTRDVSYTASFDGIWEQIAAQVAAGQTEVTVHLTESEVSSRAADYLQARDAPLDDILVCFHDGYAEGRATVEAPGASGLPLVGGLFKAESRVTGSVDLSGRHPRLVIDRLEAGDLPGFLEDEVRDDVEQAINDRLDDLPLGYDYNVSLSEGVATVVGSPRASVPVEDDQPVDGNEPQAAGQ